MYYGPESIRGARRAGAAPHGIRIEPIQPGKPQQNAGVERYHRSIRHAWRATTLLDTIEQLRDQATRRPWTYHHERPNRALGGITPRQKLAMAAWFHFWRLLKMGGLPF